MNEKYDIVGDIHGHADKLERLLRRLGYEERDGIYRHASRQLIFVGDFIDRGAEIRRTLQLVRAMVDAGTARAVMGNHEFNALLYHTKGPDGQWLRSHDEKNTFQHQATLDQIALSEPDEWKGWLDWMLQLPLWLDLGSCRVVHAAWDDAAVQACGTRDTLAEITLAKAKRRQTPEGSAVNWLLKGPEYWLSNGIVFVDKEGFKRKTVRAKWWIPIRPGMTHAEAAMPGGELRGDGCVPNGVSFRGYAEEEPPLFFGHYWLDPKGVKNPLAPNIACLDYSAGCGGPLVAYRFDGEAILKPDKFVAAE
jgi:Calcineurin-like phosphoesterase